MRLVFFGMNGLGRRLVAWLKPQYVINGPVDQNTYLGFQQPEWGISAGYCHILKPETLALFSRGVVNVHPGCLPWNRGKYPNVWPILDGSPAGVTIHRMDEGLDTGPIYAQQQLEVYDWDTAHTLYKRLEDAAETLFKKTWPKILDGLEPIPQQGKGSYHQASELEDIGVHEGLSAAETIRRLRARSFPPYGLEYTSVSGQTVRARIELEKID